MSTQTLTPFEMTILRETAAWARCGVSRIEAFVDAMHDYEIYSDMEQTQRALERRGLLDRGWDLTDAGRGVLRALGAP